MNDYEFINNMTEEELREFALFTYTAHPTLLVTHVKRQAFFAQYPEKDPRRTSKGSSQMDLALEPRSNEREDVTVACTTS